MKRDKLYVEQILDSVRKIREFVGSMTREQFDDDQKTQSAVILQLALSGAINAVIIKPTQAGSVVGACKAILVAKAAGVKTIISHHSAEVADNFIIDLAQASGADAVKIGAPIHERVEKYNRLLRLYK